MIEYISKPLKVLQVTIGDGNYGGVASFLYSYYSYMDRTKVHFDFLYCGENSMQSQMDTEVLKDAQFTTLHTLKANNNGIKQYKKLCKQLMEYFTLHNYDIVHVNTSNVYVNACISYVLKGKAILISHSHNTSATVKYGNIFKRCIKSIIKKPCQKYILKKADYYFACSKMAGENLFGENVIKSNRFRLIHNAINISQYTYNPVVRAQIRRSNKLVIGHVGRLTKQKNPEFLIEIFAEIHRMNPNTELWMIGEGELQDKIKKKILELKIKDSVKLWGRRKDVSDLMQAMDIFLLPSLYEGLSIVAIEAQAAGLPVFCSDTISPEHKITDLVQFVSLEKGKIYWAKRIVNLMEKMPERYDTSKELISAGYEISQAAKSLEGLYMKMVTIDTMEKYNSDEID